jgi:putative sterol carrier protein
MGFFKDADELDEYIGGVFRDAGGHPESGPKLRAANIVMRVLYTDPSAEVTIAFRDDYQVITGPTDIKPDITLLMRGDTADQFWRGEYNLAVGLAKGQVKAKGPVNKILKLVPLTKPLFPMYREKVAKKDDAHNTGTNTVS